MYVYGVPDVVTAGLLGPLPIPFPPKGAGHHCWELAISSESAREENPTDTGRGPKCESPSSD